MLRNKFSYILILLFLSNFSFAEEYDPSGGYMKPPHNNHGFDSDPTGGHSPSLSGPDPTGSRGAQVKRNGKVPLERLKYRKKHPNAVKAEAEKLVSECKMAADKAAGWCALNSPQIQSLLDFANMLGSIGSNKNSQSMCERAKMLSTVSAGVNSGIAAMCEQAAGGAHVAGYGYSGCTGICEKFIKDNEGDIEVNNQMMESLGAEIVRVVEASPKGEEDEGALKLYDQWEKYDTKVEVGSAAVTEAKRYYGICYQYRTSSIPTIAKAAIQAANVAASPSCDQYQMSGSLSEFCARAENRGTSVCLAAASCADPVKARQDPLCLGGGTAGVAGGLGGPAGMGGINKAGVAGGGNPLDELKKLNTKVGADGPGTQTRNEGIGGGSSGGPQAGNSGGLNPEEGGGSAPEYNTNVDQGYQRSKGGIGDGGGSMFASRGGGYLGNGGPDKKPGFDLSKYMPWMNKKSGPDRQIAEINKLKADGVTGAAGPSIWEKVSNRMRAIRPRLE